MQPFLSDCKRAFERTLEIFVKDIASLRTGRATPAIVEDIEADYYGTKTLIKHMAAINIAGPTSLVIQPWDKGALKPIEDALRKSELGINPIVDKDLIRLNLPSLTQERRQQLVKLLGQKAEEARIEIRKHREDAIRASQKLFDDKALREDEKFRAKDDIQKLTDEYNKKIEETAKKKEDDIMIV